jgi:hypothetical protein
MREKENHPLIKKHMHCLNHSDALNERQMQMYMTKGGRGAVNPINTQPPKSTPS